MADQRETTPATGTVASDTTMGHELTRKSFLTKASLGVGALVGAAIGVPVAGMALGPLTEGRKTWDVNLGSADKFAEGQYTKVTIDFTNEDPATGYVAKRVAYVRRNASGYQDPLTGEKSRFTIVSNRCVHLGCPVQSAGDTFVCPCHGGSYEESGARKAGPPVRPLDRFDFEVRGGDLVITGEYSLTNDGKRVALHGPGQATDAPIGWLFALQP